MFNLQLLEGVENEEKSSKDPESWLASVCKEPKDRENYLCNNYIPKTFILEWKNFGDFEIERKKRIKKRLYAAFNLPVPQDLSQIDED